MRPIRTAPPRVNKVDREMDRRAPELNHEWLDALHLASPSLPIGGFAYSQALEQAHASGWVNDRQSATVWIRDALMLMMARQELPAWLMGFRYARRHEWPALMALTESLAALRETAELRLESRQMAYSMNRLYDQWLPESQRPPETVTSVLVTQYTMSHAALCGLRLSSEVIGLTAFVWAWLENQVLAAIKIVPLGQLDGQALLHELKPYVAEAVSLAQITPLDQAASAPIGMAMISSRHETQYTRLFRS